MPQYEGAFFLGPKLLYIDILPTQVFDSTVLLLHGTNTLSPWISKILEVFLDTWTPQKNLL